MKPELTIVNKHLHLKVAYNPRLVDVLRDRIDDRKTYNPNDRTWSYPLETMVLERLVDVLGIERATLAPELREMLPVIEPEKPVDMSVIDGYELPSYTFEHQRRGLAELVQNDKWLLAWEMGCAKTFVAAHRIRLGFERGDFERVLVICPKSIVFVWEEQARTHADLRATLLQGTASQKHLAIKSVAHQRRAVGVVNYDALANLVDELISYAPEAVIIDECQYVKNSTAVRSKKTRKIADGARYRWALSGTPAPNGPLDFFGTLLFFGPEYAGTPYKTAFESRYAIREALPNGARVVVAYQNLGELNKKVAAVSSRVLKEDCLDLPPKVFVERRCILEGEQARVYKELRKDAVSRLSKMKAESTLTIKNILGESLRLLQVCGGFLPDDLGENHALDPNAKLKLLEEVLSEIGEDKPVIIWASFRAEISAIAEMLSHRNVRVFWGDSSDEERKQAAEDFQSGKADVFLATPQSAGMGLTLTAASNVIHYSRTFNLNTWLQANDRAHRPGQKADKVTIVSLLASGTIDEKIALSLEKKEKLQEELLTRNIEEII